MRFRSFTHKPALRGAAVVLLSTATAWAQSSTPEPFPESSATSIPEIAPAAAATPSPADPIEQQLQAAFEAAFKKIQPAIARIDSSRGLDQFCATGFFIDPAGTLITHFSAVYDADKIEVSFGGQRLPAKRLYADPRSGVAILKVDATTSFLELADPKEVKVASPVMAAGYPRNLPLSPAFGLVAGFDKTFKGNPLRTQHIRVTLPVEPGQAGAPLVNLRGEVIGMLAFCADEGSACYFLPINVAASVQNEYMRYGHVRYGRLGVEVSRLGIYGPQITIFDPSSPALAAGLQIGDVLLHMGNNSIDSSDDIDNAAFFLRAGEEISITVLRNGEKVTVTVTPALDPSANPAWRIAKDPLQNEPSTDPAEPVPSQLLSPPAPQ